MLVREVAVEGREMDFRPCKGLQEKHVDMECWAGSKHRRDGVSSPGIGKQDRGEGSETGGTEVSSADNMDPGTNECHSKVPSSCCGRGTFVSWHLMGMGHGSARNRTAPTPRRQVPL